MRKILFLLLILFTFTPFSCAKDFYQLNPQEETKIKCVPSEKYSVDNSLSFIIKNNEIYNLEGRRLKGSINNKKIQIYFQKYNDINDEIRNISINRKSGKYNSTYTIKSLLNNRWGQSTGNCFIQDKQATKS